MQKLSNVSWFGYKVNLRMNVHTGQLDRSASYCIFGDELVGVLALNLNGDLIGV